MRYVKCETVGKKNITPTEQLNRCSQNYHQKGGRERMSDYYKNRITDEQRSTRQQKCREWKARNKDRMRISRIASSTKSRVAKYRSDFDIWDMIGCDCAELAKYFDAQCEPGMDWRDGRNFEIDHIRPLCSFDLTDLSQIRECLHFSNLQVLKKTPHMGKSKEEHMSFMIKLSYDYWNLTKNTPFPGFKAAWSHYCESKYLSR